jgi:uncharacterized protein (DUF427 family)
MKLPGPDHPITVTSNPQRVVVTFHGRRIADTARALTLREASYPPVQYVPRDDVDMSVLERTDHATVCPYKGDASYFTLRVGGQTAENAVWSYEHPHAAVAGIEEYLAFYPDHVEITEHPTG